MKTYLPMMIAATSMLGCAANQTITMSRTSPRPTATFPTVWQPAQPPSALQAGYHQGGNQPVALAASPGVQPMTGPPPAPVAALASGAPRPGVGTSPAAPTSLVIPGELGGVCRSDADCQRSERCHLGQCMVSRSRQRLAISAAILPTGSAKTWYSSTGRSSSTQSYDDIWEREITAWYSHGTSSPKFEWGVYLGLAWLGGGGSETADRVVEGLTWRAVRLGGLLRWSFNPNQRIVFGMGLEPGLMVRDTDNPYFELTPNFFGTIPLSRQRQPTCLTFSIGLRGGVTSDTEYGSTQTQLFVLFPLARLGLSLGL